MSYLLAILLCAPPLFAPTGRYETYLQYWTASWCSPCKTQRPEVEAAAKELGLRIEIIDYDKNKHQAAKCKVGRLPTVCIVHEGMTREWLRGSGHSKVVIEKTVEKVRLRKVKLSLVDLHNELHGGGSWTWPGDLATHLRNVHGVEQ